MNLQTMVDTLQEVRGPDQQRLGGRTTWPRGKAGGSSQHSLCALLPPAASVSPRWSRRPFPPPLLRGWEGTSTRVAEKLGHRNPGAAPGVQERTRG